MTNPTIHSYCAALARRTDYDRYIVSLFGPRAQRPAQWALIAFAHELAKTRELVSENLLGEIRLQWWRDALEEISRGQTRDAPVVQALAEVIAAGVPRAPLDRMIDARQSDLEQAPFADMDALIRYCEASAGNLARAQLYALGVDDEIALGAAASVGTGWALVGLIRAAPFQARAGRVIVPRDLLAEAGLTQGDVKYGRGGDALSGVLAELALAAGTSLAAARAAPLTPALRRRARPVFMLGALGQLYLHRLTRTGFAWRTLGDLPSPTRRHWALIAARLRGRV